MSGLIKYHNDIGHTESFSYPKGSVLIDNTTLHAASLLLGKGRNDWYLNHLSKVPIYSLSELVESLVIHECIFIETNTLKMDFRTQQLVKICDGIIQSCKLKTSDEELWEKSKTSWNLSFQQLANILIECEGHEGIMSSKNSWYHEHASYLGFEFDDPSNGYEKFHSLFYNLHYQFRDNNRIEKRRESPLGFYNINTNQLNNYSLDSSELDYFTFLINRIIGYFELSKIIKMPYIPNISRVRLLLSILIFKEELYSSFAKVVIDKITKLRKERDIKLNEISGSSVFAIDTPIILTYIISNYKCKNIEEIIDAALELRNTKSAVNFRAWCSEITESIIKCNRENVDKALKELDKLVNALSEEHPKISWSQIAIGFPFSISFTLPTITRHPIMFMRDIHSRIKDCGDWLSNLEMNMRF